MNGRTGSMVVNSGTGAFPLTILSLEEVNIFKFLTEGVMALEKLTMSP